MKPTKLYFERTFNLGNYESAKIGLEVEITDEDKGFLLDKYKELKAQVFNLKEVGGTGK